MLFRQMHERLALSDVRVGFLKRETCLEMKNI